jgi:hypothetical protein
MRFLQLLGAMLLLILQERVLLFLNAEVDLLGLGTVEDID